LDGWSFEDSALMNLVIYLYLFLGTQLPPQYNESLNYAYIALVFAAFFVRNIMPKVFYLRVSVCSIKIIFQGYKAIL